MTKKRAPIVVATDEWALNGGLNFHLDLKWGEVKLIDLDAFRTKLVRRN